MELGTIGTFVIIYLFCLNNCLCEDRKVVFKNIPQKILPFGKVYIGNSNKFFKTHKPFNTQKSGTDKSYTFFESIVPKAKKLNVPDSLYFPLEQTYDNKPRVKKVLSEFTWGSVRNKRSAGDKPGNLLQVERRKPKLQSKNDTHPAPRKLRSHAKSNAAKNSNKHKKRSHLAKGKHHKRIGSKSTKKSAKRSKRNKIRKLKSRGQNKREGRKGKKSHRTLNRNTRGKVPVEARRLIAGRDALIENYPYVVSIQKAKEHWCAGALLNPRLVITTANCIWKANRISRLRVRAGSRYTDRGGQTARIDDVMKHPNWSIRSGPDNDIALLSLNKNIRFSDSVHGVDIPNRVMKPSFEDAWVTSWGSMRRDGVYDSSYNSLQVYHTSVLDRKLCNNVTQRFGITVSENFICLTQTGKRAPCTRDTGAPAVSDGVLWGLASWGIRKLCGTERYPAMFSYLASQSNMNFIANATRHLMADERFNPFPDRPRA